MNLIKVGNTIRVERLKRGITQQKLAELSGVSKGRIEALENGRSQDVGFNTVRSVLAALGLTLALMRSQIPHPSAVSQA